MQENSTVRKKASGRNGLQRWEDRELMRWSVRYKHLLASGWRVWDSHYFGECTEKGRAVKKIKRDAVSLAPRGWPPFGSHPYCAPTVPRPVVCTYICNTVKVVHTLFSLDTRVLVGLTPWSFLCPFREANSRTGNLQMLPPCMKTNGSLLFSQQSDTVYYPDSDICSSNTPFFKIFLILSSH
jgi:hypothetical protein